MRCLLLLLAFLFILSCSGCAGVQAVRLSAGYGPFHAEIEILLRQAEELKRVNGPDCPAAKALEERAKQLGATEVPQE